MSEVMTCSTLDEKFSFSKSKREQIQAKKETGLLTGSDIEDESTLSFTDKLDIASIKSSENTICGSDDSVVSHKNSTNADEIQDSANSTIKSDTSCEDYEYMITQSSVIDMNCNISQTSDVHDKNELKNDLYPSTVNTENEFDSKRVVVQILSSDTKDSTKSTGAYESKSINENQSNLSFRDDVCKLLTSSRPTLDYGSDTLEEKDLKEICNSTHNSLQKISSNKSFIKTVRNQRRSSINPFLLYNKGPKFSEIKHVSRHVKAATASALRAIHFLLYDKYGLCGNEMQLARTKRRILRFSGYPFENKCSKYQKKLKSLLKMPIEMLLEVHEAIFGKTPSLQRLHMANNLMTVFSDTERYSEIIGFMKQNIKLIPEEEYIALKEKAILGPPPTVILEKLSSEFLAHALSIRDSDKKVRIRKENLESKLAKMNEKLQLCENQDELLYDLPAYILKGPGRKLKCFRTVVENVKKANEKEINLLHHLLYGREESVDVCRRNILEFSGFLECQNEFIYNVHDTLMRLDGSEILKICKILCLRATTNSRKRKILKILEYLKKPFNPLKIKVAGFRQKIFPKHSSQLLHPISPISKPRASVHPLLMWEEPENAVCDEAGYRLKDFRRICSNIECSAPSDLTELNDLLFMKPSDDTEIHDRILNFTRFGFSESSVHYHYRKTLMFYMGPCIVRKIAKLLDIENWNLISNHEDLSACILNFLMEKKGPGNPSGQSESVSVNNIPVQHAQQSNQTTTICQENVVISVSKSTVLADLGCASDKEYSYTESHKKFDHLMSSANNQEEDFVPLRDFIHHPTDEELKEDIDDIVKNGLFTITLGDVVRRIYLKYPCFNLTYREQFIKSEIRKIVSQLRQNAVEKMKQYSVT